METGSYHKRVLPVACRNISENVSTYCMTMKLELTLNSFISIIWIVAVKKGEKKNTPLEHRVSIVERLSAYFWQNCSVYDTSMSSLHGSLDKKIVRAISNFKMAAIFQDGRHGAVWLKK